MVNQLDTYRWSSYPYYVSKLPKPIWLYRDEIYQQLSVKSQQREKYRAFVEMGVDEEIKLFYGKGNQKPYLGSDQFRDWVYQQRGVNDAEINRVDLQSFRPGIDQITESVARHFKVDADTITVSRRGIVNENIPRWVVMYLAQEMSGLKLRVIADYLGLKRTGSIPTTIAKLRLRMEIDEGLSRIVEKIKRQYYT